MTLSWDDLQFFLAVAREGQLSRAARLLGTSHVTVSRRIDRLEQALNARLFERNPRGYEPTPAGRRLIETAERMEEAADQIPVEQGTASRQAGPLRLAVPEGFGSLFSQHLWPDFIARFPLISLELITLPQIMSLSRREADMSVTLDPVAAGPYRSERIAHYTLHLYATRTYLDQTSRITRPEDLRAHRIIGYIEEMIFAPGLDYLKDVLPGLRASIKSSSIFNQLAAARNHLGIAVLPHYIAVKYPELSLILPGEMTLTRSYWLTCHRDVRAMRRERAVIAFLTESLHARAGQLIGPGPAIPPELTESR